MKFAYNKENWDTIENGEENCFILTNSLGGYCSLSVIGSNVRNDHALLMAVQKAPNVRCHLLTNVIEKIYINGVEYVVSSQRYMDNKNLNGHEYLEEFSFEHFPVWYYKIEDVLICKTIIMVHGENTIGIKYSIENPSEKDIKLEILPLLRFTPKNEVLQKGQLFEVEENKIVSNGYELYFASEAAVMIKEGAYLGPLYFTQDERDGRDFGSFVYINHALEYKTQRPQEEYVVVYSTNPYEYYEGMFDDLLEMELEYRSNLLEIAGIQSELGKQLVLSADAYIVNRDSTMGKSIIAGYPFFEDWGRDTMISIPGITLVTGRFSECKSILRTFAQYMRNGLLPNLFPEGDKEPMYNSADAPLLFINAVYEYMEFTKDQEFLSEIWPALVQIVRSYSEGTDYHICMDEDGLIQAGDGQEQLTWMDVRIGDYLPTPRHGKPVEINAYWYNALCIMAYWSERIAGEQEENISLANEYYTLSGEYSSLAAKVKNSFLMKFWNEEEACFKDVLSENEEENQVRCNQVWTLSLPFTVVNQEMSEKVLQKIKEELYTPIGLRSLSPKDNSFHPVYLGDMVKRDHAYHQGTVWAFPLGAYYRACMKSVEHSSDEERSIMLQEISEGIEALKFWLKEGCVGQIAEIYDGGEPTVSRGCFAQAWSVGELLRAVYDWEKLCGSML